MQTNSDRKAHSTQARAKHSLNKSKAKAQFSFSRADRFSNRSYKSTSQLKFYDIQDTRHKQKVNFSSGQRSDFIKKDGVPPSTYYNVVSVLANKNNGIVFKNGRDQCKANCLFAQASNKNPGPGQYSPESSAKYKSIRYSIGKRNKTMQDPQNQQSTPGPKYNINSTLLDNQKFLSIYVRRGSAKICNPITNVFANKKQNTNNKTRANQSCRNQDELETRYISNKGIKNFGHNGPKTFIRPSSVNLPTKGKIQSTPGPGQYSSFSEFLH